MDPDPSERTMSWIDLTRACSRPFPSPARTRLRTARMAVTALTCGAMAAGAQQAPTQAEAVTGSVLIQNVRLFDGDRVIPRTSVLVTDGRIARVAPTITAP